MITRLAWQFSTISCSFLPKRTLSPEGTIIVLSIAEEFDLVLEPSKTWKISIFYFGVRYFHADRSQNLEKLLYLVFACQNKIDRFQVVLLFFCQFRDVIWAISMQLCSTNAQQNETEVKNEKSSYKSGNIIPKL